MNNLFEIIQLRKVMEILIPEQFGNQTDILERYIKDTRVDGLSDCMVRSTSVRRSGVSTVALAIALAEATLGKSVLYVGENSYETNNILRSISTLSGMNGWLSQSKLKIATPDANVKGSKYDIVLYETFVRHSINPQANIGVIRSLRSLHDKWILDTKCKLVYTIHA